MTDRLQVSLDSRVREIINKNMMSPTQRTFDEAQLQIYTLMHRDSYPRFVNSPGYRNLLKTYGGSVRDLTVSHPTWRFPAGVLRTEKEENIMFGSYRNVNILSKLTLYHPVTVLLTVLSTSTWNFSQNVKNDSFCWPTKIYQRGKGMRK